MVPIQYRENHEPLLSEGEGLKLNVVEFEVGLALEKEGIVSLHLNIYNRKRSCATGYSKGISIG